MHLHLNKSDLRHGFLNPFLFLYPAHLLTFCFFSAQHHPFSQQPCRVTGIHSCWWHRSPQFPSSIASVPSRGGRSHSRRVLAMPWSCVASLARRCNCDRSNRKLTNQKARKKMENVLLSPGAPHLFRVRIPATERGL